MKSQLNFLTLTQLNIISLTIKKKIFGKILKQIMYLN